MIRIDRHTLLRDDDVAFAFDRSGGPGGQNVNKVATRVTLWFDVRGCSSLSVEQRGRLERVLGGRLDRDGRLRIVCQTHRSQSGNRREAVQRLVDLLRGALRPPKVRRATRPTVAAGERRLRSKSRRSEVKRQRRARGDEGS